MKIREYIRLARINVKEHKPQTANTVRGLAFSAILLTPIVFLFFAFYMGSMNSIDSVNAISSFHLKYDAKYATSDINAIDDTYYDEILNLNGVINSAVYKQASIPIRYHKRVGTSQYEWVRLNSKITIENQVYEIDYLDDEQKIELYNMNKTNHIVSQAEEDYLMESYHETAILAGSSDIKAEQSVVISSSVLDHFKLSYKDVIGKSVSYEIASIEEIQNSENEITYNEIYLPGFENYKIVGVFNSNLYTSVSREVTDLPLLWMNDTVLYQDGMLDYIEEIKKENMPNDRMGYSYQYRDSIETVARQTVEKGKLFLPFGQGCYGITLYEQILQFDSFTSAHNSVDFILDYQSNSYDHTNPVVFNRTNAYFLNDIFNQVYEMYPLILGVSLILFIFACVLLFTTILNLYNTLVYSTTKRKGFLGMMRAIGMTKTEVRNLYFWEILILLLRALVWILVFSIAISLGIMLIMNMNLSRYNAYLPVDISLNFGYYPLAVILVGAILVSISFVISFVLFLDNKKKLWN